ncbi:dTDP-4-dehydrorhamnose 3,5-epimerase [Cellulophaga sp. BC115SP]|uniref:dTDP-4-dehydrorhamnose 3,5-epimerase n=1 Tax=Cellulophaga sp. BC115SP TaxID=2683263 RepID=UPI0014136EBA|nr:dTDP-4-dehydrorhamnose 3,5-epimerase [Cellulophaga sp. BC115SP]NBB30521.1 dTDP-4-dehydrorhamnose 3,5-epimerase [Cellulophaga sp. BC115SP]
MKVSTAKLTDVLIIEPAVFGDSRGLFFESFNSITWKEKGLPYQFVQDNQSFSSKGVLRGLHFQKGEYAQGKLVRVISGKVLDIAVDLRPDSPTFSQWEFYELDDISNKMIYIPTGFAHGFLALENSIFSYKCTAGYHKASEGGIIWNDPTLNIEWPISDPNVSEKDLILPTFETYKVELGL